MQINPDKPTIFISHCWGDREFYKEKTYSYFKNLGYNVMYDKKEFLVGDNLKEREEDLKHTDAIIVFLSKTYIQKVNKNEDSGVFRENNHINDLKKQKDENNETPIFYFLLDNLDKVKNLSDFVGDDVYYPLYSININRYSNKDTISKEDENNIQQQYRGIISRANVHFSLKTPKIADQIEAERKLLYFSRSDGQLPCECMVYTEAVRKFITHSAFVMSGRKGSGKTTLYEILQRYPNTRFFEKYKNCIPISAEYLQVERIFDLYNQNIEDIKMVGEDKFLDEFWKTYLSLHTYYTLCNEGYGNRIVSEKQNENVNRMIRKLKKILSIKKFSDIDEYTIPKLAFTQVVEFLQKKVIDFANVEAYEASLSVNFNYKNILRFILSERIFDLFLDTLNECKKKVFIYIDAFDTQSQEFALHTIKDIREVDPELANRRSSFEAYLFSHLIVLVEEKIKKIKILNQLDYCLLFPKDKIDMIKDIDRDFAKKKIVTLQWSGNELLKMICLRIEYIYKNFKKSDAEIEEINFILNEKKSLLEKCSNLLAKYCPNIPEEIKIETDDSTKSIKLLNYLLSISLWRPRDILSYLWTIIELSRANEGLEVGSTVVKEKLRKASKLIIQKEFIDEYQSAMPNLATIIKSFKRQQIIYSQSELYKLLNSIEFSNSLNIDTKSFVDKLKILYELGLIGVMSYEKNKTRYSFIFNEGFEPIEEVDIDDNNQYIVNPIFYEYNKMVYNSKNIVCDYDEEYLQMNSAMQL